MRKLLFFVFIVAFFLACGENSQKTDSQNTGEISQNVPIGINEQAPQIDQNAPPVPVGE